MVGQSAINQTDHNVKRSAFLASYAEGESMRGAAKVAGMSHTLHYYWMDNMPEYPEEFELAHRAHIQAYIDECERRGRRGVDDIVLYEGKPVEIDDPDNPGKKIPYIRTKFSDNLLMFRIKQGDPSYRENAEVLVKHTIDVAAIEETLKLLQSQGLQLPDPTMVIEGEIVEDGA